MLATCVHAIREWAAVYPGPECACVAARARAGGFGSISRLTLSGSGVVAANMGEHLTDSEKDTIQKEPIDPPPRSAVVSADFHFMCGRGAPGEERCRFLGDVRRVCSVYGFPVSTAAFEAVCLFEEFHAARIWPWGRARGPRLSGLVLPR